MQISNVCSSCGGELNYNFDSKNLICSQCGNIVKIPNPEIISNIKKPFDENSTIKQKQVKNLTYKCANCDKTCIIQNDSTTLRCAYCGSPDLTRQSKIEFVPDGIVPFKLNKQRAMSCFIDYIRKKHFLPKNLRKQITDKELSPVYFPIYDYNFKCFSSYSGVGVNYSEGPEGRKKESPYSFSGTKNTSFTDFIESASTDLPTYELQNFGNFNLKSLCVYRSEYLYGITSLEANIDLQTGCKHTKFKIERIIENDIKKSYHFDDIRNFSYKTSFEEVTYSHIYVPVWIRKFKFKNKLYSFFINGTTGKVSGSVPRSPLKILLAALGVLCGIGALGILFYLLYNGAI